MDQTFFDDLKNSKEITRDEWKHRGLKERLKEIGAGTIEPLL
jgi:hypothetical protein